MLYIITIVSRYTLENYFIRLLMVLYALLHNYEQVFFSNDDATIEWTCLNFATELISSFFHWLHWPLDHFRNMMNYMPLSHISNNESSASLDVQVTIWVNKFENPFVCQCCSQQEMFVQISPFYSNSTRTVNQNVKISKFFQMVSFTSPKRQRSTVESCP